MGEFIYVSPEMNETEIRDEIEKGYENSVLNEFIETEKNKED